MYSKLSGYRVRLAALVLIAAPVNWTVGEGWEVGPLSSRANVRATRLARRRPTLVRRRVVGRSRSLGGCSLVRTVIVALGIRSEKSPQ